eukprot:sb/3474444/
MTSPAPTKEQQEFIRKLQTEREKLQVLSKEYQKFITTRQQFDAQLNENELVLSEFGRLKDNSEVFKLVGPLLVKQEVPEAVSTVKKRINFIKGELERCDKNITGSEEKQARSRDALAKIQQQYQAKMQAAAAAAGAS